MGESSGQNEAVVEDWRARWFIVELVSLIVLTPVLAWLAPKGFAPLVALAGVLSLPIISGPFKVSRTGLAAAALLAWALTTALWSRFEAPTLEKFVGAKVVGLALCCWVLVWASKLFAQRSRRWAECGLFHTMLGLGVLMIAESWDRGRLYAGLLELIGQHMRPDLAAKNVAQALYVLALLAPLSALAGREVSTARWVILAGALAIMMGALALDTTAPTLALALAALSAGVVYSAPLWGPRLISAAVLIYFIGAPWVVALADKAGLIAYISPALPLSWSQRIGYWRFAAGRILERPVQGWGLDASRTFAPDIQLHPHNAAIQIWLELGAAGALLAGGLVASLVWRLGGRTRSPQSVAGVATIVAYLAIGAVSFGVWQEWWLSLAGLAACLWITLSRSQAGGEGAEEARS